MNMRLMDGKMISRLCDCTAQPAVSAYRPIAQNTYMHLCVPLLQKPFVVRESHIFRLYVNPRVISARTMQAYRHVPTADKGWCSGQRYLRCSTINL